MSPLALAAALLVAASPAPNLSVMEQRYVDARAAATARFGQGGGPEAAERQAMADLESQLRALVGPVRLPGLTGAGELAYDGFWGVGSSEVADGLVFKWRDDSLFVTTRALYMRSAATALPQDIRTVDDVLASKTVVGNAAFVTFAELPIRHSALTKRVRAVVGVAAQDYGPWPPNILVVQMERGERVFVAGASLKPSLEQVADCETKFNADWEKIPSGASNLNRLQDDAFDAYRRCVGPVLPSRPSFAAVLGRAQAIVDQLEASDVKEPPAGR